MMGTSLYFRHRDCLEDSDEATGTCSLKLFPEENSWHYITVTPTRPDRKIEFAINVVITGMDDCKQKLTVVDSGLKMNFLFFIRLQAKVKSC